MNFIFSQTRQGVTSQLPCLVVNISDNGRVESIVAQESLFLLSMQFLVIFEAYLVCLLNSPILNWSST
jgi:hypothetical protein